MASAYQRFYEVGFTTDFGCLDMPSDQRIEGKRKEIAVLDIDETKLGSTQFALGPSWPLALLTDST